jgi:TRAP-type uncharacterized transport system substrate-binding protein
MYIVYLCIVILIYYIHYRTIPHNDHFTNYKTVIVTPQPTIYSGLQLNLYSKSSFLNDIAKHIKNIYPIKTISSQEGSLLNLYTTNKSPNVISLIQEPAFYHFQQKQPDHNIRFISSLGLEKFTLIVTIHSKILDWNTIDNHTIGTLSNNSGSYIVLQQIKTIFKMNFSIKQYSTFSSNISKDLKDTTIDAFFIITSHPNTIIQSIHKDLSLRIIGIDKLSRDTLRLAFPQLQLSSIDLTHYNIFTNIPATLSCRIDIVCHDKLPDLDAYNLIQTVFKNFIDFKTKGSSNYKLRMRDFNPEYIYLSHNKYTLHTGVYKFYKEIGLITNNPSDHCRYKVGIGKCNMDTLNNFRLLSHSRLL